MRIRKPLQADCAAGKPHKMHPLERHLPNGRQLDTPSAVVPQVEVYHCCISCFVEVIDGLAECTPQGHVPLLQRAGCKPLVPALPKPRRTCEVSTFDTFAFGGGPVGAGGGGCAGCGGVPGPLVWWWKGDAPAGPAPKLAAAEGVIAGERVGTNAGGATWRVPKEAREGLR